MIELLFFAQLREEVGAASLTIDASEITVEQIKKQYLAKYEMDELLKSAMVAVNEEYAAEDTVVHAGDTVAFIPPVSGG
ncbi:MAG TPA: molybdopterin converting factor subunit 1 [Pseudogracilibacillus sp.]|nr:molybdopterin converting factor subunit 1 [Pseudogracilibacillus sp.]